MVKEKSFTQKAKDGFSADKRGEEEFQRKTLIKNITRSNRTKRDKFYFVKNPGL